MELENVVENGVNVPVDAQALSEGTRVCLEPAAVAKQATFGELFGDLMIDSPELPSDLAAQPEHYLVQKPKRALR